MSAPSSHVDPRALWRAAERLGEAIGVPVSPARADPRASHPVLAIAQTSGLRARRVRLTGRWWTEDVGPLLVFSSADGAPLVLLPDPWGGSYTVFDPRTEAEAALDPAAVDTEAFAFVRPLFGTIVSAGALLRHVAHRRGRDGFRVVGWTLAATGMAALAPMVTGMLVDVAIPDADRRLVLTVALGLAAAAVGSAAFSLVRGLALARADAGVGAEAQVALWDRLLRLPPSFFRRFDAGDLYARVSAVELAGRELGQVTLTSVIGGLLALLYLPLLAVLNGRLSLLAVAFSVAVAIATVVPGVWIVRRARRTEAQSAALFSSVVQLIGGVPKLRAALAEDRAFSWWRTRHHALARERSELWRIQDGVALVHRALPGLGALVLFAAAAPDIATGSMSAGVFLSFQAVFSLLVASLVSLSSAAVQIADAAALLERARPLFEAAPESALDLAWPGELRGAVAVKDAVFRYRADGRNVLDGVTIRAEPGEMIALVGASGSGKSTVLRLLLGFEQPWSGRVLIDGQDLAGLDREAVRRQIGVVMQDGRVPVGSIRDVVAGAGRVSMDEVWDALRGAGLDADVRAMPMGLHTMVSPAGGNLSGGQRQRLLIARALVRRPRLLLLDEATSALDPQTQAAVSAHIAGLGVTRIVVAHRPSTIRRADRIYVIDAGRVVQEGTYEELIATEGPFAELAARSHS